MRILTDGQATRANILRALDWACGGAAQAFLVFCGAGMQVGGNTNRSEMFRWTFRQFSSSFRYPESSRRISDF